MCPGTRSEDTIADRTLIDRFEHRRDEAAFRSLYRRHTPTIYALAMRLVAGSRSDADELVQETWVRAVEGFDGFAWRSSFRTWLRAILVNCYREAVRRRARAPRSLDETSDGETGIGFPRPVPARADRIDVERAIAQLPNGYREVLVLHDLNGYTHQEIADLLDIEEGTSKSQLNRGRKRLKQLLEAGIAERRSHGTKGDSA